MAIAPKRPCRASGCGGYAVVGGYCERHQDKIRQPDRERGTSSERGYGSKWRVARLQHLEFHPLCVRCEADGIVVAASVVDHIIPHKGNDKLFWDRKNWQSLCKPCHDSKTANEDGGVWIPNPKRTKNDQ